MTEPDDGETGTTRPRALVVDDNALVRRSVSRTLGRFGFEVTEVDGSQIAIEILGARQFELVLSDYDLGDGTTGLEVLREAQRACPSSCRVLMSGSMDADLSAKHLASGLLHEMLEKPIAAASLAALRERCGR